MIRSATLARVAEIAEDQWGLVTRQQARLAGVPQTTLERLTAPGSVLERVAYGVYRLTGAPEPDHLELRAAWLQLSPRTWAWERAPEQGVVSHRSAAALYGLGHLPADRHDFTLPARKQTRRDDVCLHQRPLAGGDWVPLRGLPATRPPRTVSDLLHAREDPEAAAHIVADALRGLHETPAAFASALAPHAARFGTHRGDGFALLHWLLDLVDDPSTPQWLDEAQAHLHEAAAPHSEQHPGDPR
jgi:Transcriptional regulator, AbiEi antitoxin